jgi:single-strand DNA-binding protein
MNKVVLMGRLGKDVEVAHTQNGATYAKFSLATKHPWNKEETHWHNIICWNKTAELAGNYLSKGDQVLIEGFINYNKWDDNGKTRIYTDIVATNIEFISGGSNQNQNQGYKNPTPPPAPGYDPDDVPF